jgi:hypothetical protein
MANKALARFLFLFIFPMIPGRYPLGIMGTQKERTEKHETIYFLFQNARPLRRKNSHAVSCRPTTPQKSACCFTTSLPK